MIKHILTILFALTLLFTAKGVFAATEFISIIDPDNAVGTDYTSLSAWESAVQTDLTATTTLVFSVDTISGTTTDGATTTGQTSGAIARVVHLASSSGQILLEVSTGTFQNGEVISTGFGTSTITATGTQAIAVAQARSTGGSPDTTAVTIDGWTTASTTYIKIWTDPTDPHGRHNGKWDDSKYRLEVSGDHGMRVQEGNTWVDGLQIKLLNITSNDMGIFVTGTLGSNSNVKISNNILQGTTSTASYHMGIDVWQTTGSGNVYIWNNFIYNFRRITGNSTEGIGIEDNYTYYVYNNTLYNNGEGIHRWGGTAILKNNLVYSSSGSDYIGTFDASSEYNLSSDATAPGSNSLVSTTVQFVDATNGDFHLSPNDTAARDAGTSTVVNTITDTWYDIDGTARGGAFDIGADELPVEFVSTICEAGASDCSVTADYNTLASWEDAVESDLTASSTRVFGGTLTGVLSENDTVALLKNGTTTGITATVVATTSAGQLLVDNVSAGLRRPTSQTFETSDVSADLPLIVSSSSVWQLDASNYFTVTGTGDALGASPWATAKIDGTWSAADTSNVSLNGWSTDNDNKIKIYTVNSARHDGKWDTSAYQLEVTDNYALNSNENYFWIDGLQVYNISTGPGSSRAGIRNDADAENGSDVWISNNIVKGNYASTTSAGGGIVVSPDIDSNNESTRIWNNIVYNFIYNRTGISVGQGSSYVYNNTVYNSSACFNSGSGAVDDIEILYNNIAQCDIASSTYTDYQFISGGTYSNNIASDSTSPNNSFDNISISFVSTSTEDFHLALTDTVAIDAGADLSSDAGIPASAGMTVDVDGGARGATAWDIGADETATKIYRSVGPGSTSALATGASNAMTISSSTSLATFASALADNIGVGDAIQYDSDGDSAVDEIVFIHARTDSQTYTVKTASGTAPTDTTADTDWSLCRAYTSLANAEAGTENTACLDDVLENFDWWSDGKDLVTSNEQWNIAAYKDAVEDLSPTPITVDGWTTNAQNYVRFFTPVTSSEVGTSQRHSGKPNTGFRINKNGNINSAITISDDYTVIDGFEVYNFENHYTSIAMYPYFSSYVTVKNNLVYNLTKISDGTGIHAHIGDGTRDAKIYNNIVFGFEVGIEIYGNDNIAYNNTLYNNNTGIYRYDNTNIAKNNLSYNNSIQDFYNGNVDNTSAENNLSSDGTAPGTNSVASATVQFADATNNDFHLSPHDTAARNAGADLSSDSLYSPPCEGGVPGGGGGLACDIDGHARPSNPGTFDRKWDIGADQGANAVYYSVGQIGTDHKTGAPTITIASGTATFSVAQTGTTTGVGDAVSYGTPAQTAYISKKIDTSTWNLVTNTGDMPVDVSVATTVASISHVYTSLSSAEAGAPTLLGTSDLSASTTNYTLNFPAYYDNGPDTTAVTIDGYTTGANNWIKIYTPNNTTGEVNLSQRHSGVWDDGKYYMKLTNEIGFVVKDNNVILDGLQVSLLGSVEYRYNMRMSGGRNNVTFSNNILQDSGLANRRYGIYDTSTSNYKIYVYNNIIYGFNGGVSSSGITLSSIDDDVFIYSNTIYDSYIGIETGYKDSIVKNNLVQNCTNGYKGTFSTQSNYNISDQSSDAPGSNSRNSTTVQFRNVVNNDFRLDPTDTVAKDAGKDLSADANYAFSADIEGDERKDNLWDIGADESPDIIYRSVGNDSRDLATSGSTVTIASTTATFSLGQADNIGVGDVVEYGNPLKIAFIQGRTSSTTYEVRAWDANYPTATTSASASIYRAHLKLDDWEDQVVGDVNQSIDSSLQASVLVGQDLVASNTAMFATAYASTSPDDLAVDIYGWTTGTSSYIKIYTPTELTEVGETQRHSGVWDESKYTLTNSLNTQIEDLKVEGLQIKITKTSGQSSGIRAPSGSSVNRGSVVISDNMIQGILSGSVDFCRGILANDPEQTLYAYNNIIYDWVNSTSTCYGIQVGVKDAYIYNNTLTNNRVGVNVSFGSTTLKNNAVFNNNDDFSGTFTTLDHNASDDGDGTNAISLGSSTLEWEKAFVDYANYDFRVRDIASPLYDAGTTITIVTDDIAGNPRPYHDAYDVGAFEYSNLKPKYRFQGTFRFKGGTFLFK